MKCSISRLPSCIPTSFPRTQITFSPDFTTRRDDSPLRKAGGFSGSPPRFAIERNLNSRADRNCNGRCAQWSRHSRSLLLACCPGKARRAFSSDDHVRAVRKPRDQSDKATLAASGAIRHSAASPSALERQQGLSKIRSCPVVTVVIATSSTPRWRKVTEKISVEKLRYQSITGGNHSISTDFCTNDPQRTSFSSSPLGGIAL
jgi:hypothetical protein